MLYYGPADDAEGAVHSGSDRLTAPVVFHKKGSRTFPIFGGAGAVFLRQPPEYAFVNFSIAVAIFF